MRALAPPKHKRNRKDKRACSLPSQFPMCIRANHKGNAGYCELFEGNKSIQHLQTPCCYHEVAVRFNTDLYYIPVDDILFCEAGFSVSTLINIKYHKKTGKTEMRVVALICFHEFKSCIGTQQVHTSYY